MKMQWISSLQDRPRCRASDGAGRRCREPVLWDERTNRPLSTRCQAHGGLADVALMGWRLPDGYESPDRMVPLCCAENDRAGSAGKRPAMDFGRILGGLPALALAGVLCLFLTAPALADFETAVAAYERGDYQEARTEFESLAAAGDVRAEPYLNKIRQELTDEEQTAGSFTSTLSDSVSSFFSESETSDNDPASGAVVTDAGRSTAARSQESASDDKPAHWEPWMPREEGTESARPSSHTGSDIVTPQRRSIWSTLFHLPGDATVIGLQYVAHFLEADNLSRELQMISRHSEKMTLSILAGFWWLAIIKVVVGLGIAVSRFMKAATTMTERRNYG